jgi:hypothetical protein
MENLNGLLKKIKKAETEHYNRCSHPTSDAIVCLNLSYEIWQLKVKIQKLK